MLPDICENRSETTKFQKLKTVNGLRRHHLKKVQKSKVFQIYKTLMLKFHQFYSGENTGRDTNKTRKTPFLQLKTAKNSSCSNKNVSKNGKLKAN